ncbi:hypothetical protein J7S70_04050 [Proteus mirabilis]|uniref:hypothetical protein n=1 Tax=Proteus mirabilis TaxID=584 RepID=UPI001B4E0790|nr:hypothetical protein [Proteus mirabilis]EKV1609120.1 hypothetical protein [Proteus mirabilis]MBQ0617026.1 hypothetical protein [Proteus mirabilis]
MMKSDILEVLNLLRLQGKQMIELIEESEAQAVRIRKRVEALEKQTVRDNRNWRCFIGFHQWEIHGHATWTESVDGEVSETGNLYVLRCVHCGELKSKYI